MKSGSRHVSDYIEIPYEFKTCAFSRQHATSLWAANGHNFGRRSRSIGPGWAPESLRGADPTPSTLGLWARLRPGRRPIQSRRYYAERLFSGPWRNPGLLSEPAKFGPWLGRIVFGVAVDWLRTFRPDLYRLADSDSELVLFSPPSSTVSSDANAVVVAVLSWEAMSRRAAGCFGVVALGVRASALFLVCKRRYPRFSLLV